MACGRLWAYIRLTSTRVALLALALSTLAPAVSAWPMEVSGPAVIVDVKLLEALNCPVVKDESLPIKTVHQEVDHKLYMGHVRFPATPFPINSEFYVVAASIDDGTRAYQAVFGT